MRSSAVGFFSRNALSTVLAMGTIAFVAGGASLFLASAPLWALLCLATLPALAAASGNIFRARDSALVVSAPSIAVGLQAIVFVVVPVSWYLGLADPWPQFADNMTLVVGAGLLFFGVFVAATAASIPRLWPKGGLRAVGDDWVQSERNERFLSATLVVGSVGFVAFVVAQGGLGRATSTIYFARSELAGLGILFVPMLVPAFGVALGVLTYRHSRRALVLIGANAIVYLSGVFLTGFKVRAVLLFVVVLVAASMRWRLKWRYVAILVLAFVPLSVWYHDTVRTGWSLGTSEVRSVRALSIGEGVASVWGPFSEDGLDVVRTLGTVAVSDRIGSESPLVIMAAPLTTLPSWIVPSKPVGSSVEFSRQFFGRQWAAGTGIPPSWAAELLWVFGWAGALFLYAVSAVAVVAIDARLLKSGNVAVAALARGTFAVFVALLLKSGSGSAARTTLLFALAAAMSYTLWRTQAVGRSEGPVTRHPQSVSRRVAS